MSAVDELLEFLADGKWHSINEIKNKLNLEETKLNAIIKFLLDFDLASNQGGKIRLKPCLRQLILNSRESRKKRRHKREWLLLVLLLEFLTIALLCLGIIWNLTPAIGSIREEVVELEAQRLALYAEKSALYTITVFGRVVEARGVGEGSVHILSNTTIITLDHTNSTIELLMDRVSGVRICILHYTWDFNTPLLLLYIAYALLCTLFTRYSDVRRVFALWMVVPILIQGRTILFDQDTRIVFLKEATKLSLWTLIFSLNTSSLLFLASSLILFTHKTRNYWKGWKRYILYALTVALVLFKNYQSSVLFLGFYDPCLEYAHTYIEMGGMVLGLLLATRYGLKPKGSLLKVLTWPVLLLAIASTCEVYGVRII